MKCLICLFSNKNIFVLLFIHFLHGCVVASWWTNLYFTIQMRSGIVMWFLYFLFLSLSTTNINPELHVIYVGGKKKNLSIMTWFYHFVMGTVIGCIYRETQRDRSMRRKKERHTVMLPCGPPCGALQKIKRNRNDVLKTERANIRESFYSMNHVNLLPNTSC